METHHFWRVIFSKGLTLEFFLSTSYALKTQETGNRDWLSIVDQRRVTSSNYVFSSMYVIISTELMILYHSILLSQWHRLGNSNSSFYVCSMIFCVTKLCYFRTVFYFLVISICPSNEIRFSQVQFVNDSPGKVFQGRYCIINVNMIRPKNISYCWISFYHDLC